jgi:omega-amidase
VGESLRVAAIAMTAGAEPRANAATIAAALGTARAAGAALLLTPECALTGYPTAARASLDDLDWDEVLELEADLGTRARALGVGLVLGTAGRLSGVATNDALACGAVDGVVRYRKQCLTPPDRRHFAAGSEAGLFTCAGWRLGLTICFDVRFGDVWHELAGADADGFVNIAHMAGPDVDPGTKAEVIPAFYATRAAEWATPLVVCNTSAPDRWIDSAHWDARGVRVTSAADGLMVTELRRRVQHASWYTRLRDQQRARASAPAAAKVRES